MLVSWRLCVDYWGLSKITAENRVPAPDDARDALASVEVFSTIYLRLGYHQIGLREKHTPTTAFSSRPGLCEWNVAARANTRSDLHSLTHELLGDLLDKTVVV